MYVIVVFTQWIHGNIWLDEEIRLEQTAVAPFPGLSTIHYSITSEYKNWKNGRWEGLGVRLICSASSGSRVLPQCCLGLYLKHWSIQHGGSSQEPWDRFLVSTSFRFPLITSEMFCTWPLIRLQVTKCSHEEYNEPHLTPLINVHFRAGLSCKMQLTV